jgi:CRP/FNR family transcriptional regulator, anaerobic regulatory protein
LKEVKKNPQATASDYANLKNFYLLNQLNNKELKQISLFLLRRKFSKGEMLYKANFPHTVLYFVVEGEIKIFLENNGTEIELIRKKEYEHFGEIGLFLEMNRSAGARAEKDSTLLAMTKKDFQEYVHQNPKTGVKLLSAISSYLCEILIKNNEQLTKKAEQSNEENQSG